MAYPRSEAFVERQLDLAEAARALGHPGRLAILEVLASRNTCNCGELVDEIPLAQATVSQHLKVLKSAGLIQGTIEGPRLIRGREPYRLALCQPIQLVRRSRDPNRLRPDTPPGLHTPSRRTKILVRNY